jgi:hypothetical protein
MHVTDVVCRRELRALCAKAAVTTGAASAECHLTLAEMVAPTMLTVKPSGLALSVVRGWLDQSEERAVGGQEREEDVVELDARPDRLGLGAKFLSHNRAMLASTTSAVEARLGKKLQQYKPDEVCRPGFGMPVVGTGGEAWRGDTTCWFVSPFSGLRGMGFRLQRTLTNQH